MKRTPAIAQRRRQEATAKFASKLDALEMILNEGTLDRFPKRASVSTFAAWEDASLGVLPVSRSVIYDESDEYLAMRQRMDHLLHLVEKARAKSSKRGNLEAELRRKLSMAEERAQAYVNQYSSAMAELSVARKEIERLNNKIRRQIATAARLTPLRTTTNKLDQGN